MGGGFKCVCISTPNWGRFQLDKKPVPIGLNYQPLSGGMLKDYHSYNGEPLPVTSGIIKPLFCAIYRGHNPIRITSRSSRGPPCKVCHWQISFCWFGMSFNTTIFQQNMKSRLQLTLTIRFGLESY